MTAVTLINTPSLAGGTASPQALSIPASTGANKRMALWCYHAEGNSSGPPTLSNVVYDAGGTPKSMTYVGRATIDGGTGARETVEVWRLMQADMSAGAEAAKTFGWTVASGGLGTARQSVFVFDGVDQTTPIAASGTTTINAGTGPASIALTINTDGAGISFINTNDNTFTHTWDATEAWTASFDTAGSTIFKGSAAYKIASGAQTAKVSISSTGYSAMIAVAINADGLASPIDLTSVNGGSAVYEGQTSVALVGTQMNATGASARLRISSATSTYQAVDSYIASSSTDATCTIPTLTSLPFTSGSWVIEAIGTATAGNDTSAVTVTLNPPSGYSVVELAVAYTGADSLLSRVSGSTVAVTDQIEWDSSVTVGSVTVTITVNDDGTVMLDSGSDPMPASVPLTWRYWSSSDKLWSAWATLNLATGASGGSVGAVASIMRYRDRNHMRSR